MYYEAFQHLKVFLHLCISYKTNVLPSFIYPTPVLLGSKGHLSVLTCRYDHKWDSPEVLCSPIEFEIALPPHDLMPPLHYSIHYCYYQPKKRMELKRRRSYTQCQSFMYNYMYCSGINTADMLVSLTMYMCITITTCTKTILYK